VTRFAVTPGALEESPVWIRISRLLRVIHVCNSARYWFGIYRWVIRVADFCPDWWVNSFYAEFFNPIA
jgi:hypothetical protein